MKPKKKRPTRSVIQIELRSRQYQVYPWSVAELLNFIVNELEAENISAFVTIKKVRIKRAL